MDKLCPYSQALKFVGENHFKCCQSGKVRLEPLSPHPLELRELLTGGTPAAKHFQKDIRIYNNAFSFGSFGADLRPPPGNGPPCFRLCGQLYHRVGCLHPAANVRLSYSQLYIIEAGEAFNARMDNPANAQCRQDVMHILQQVMDRESPFIAAYKNMAQVEQEENTRAIQENRTPSIVKMMMKAGPDRRRYNTPSHEEVAAIFIGEDGAPPAQRDIVIYPRDHALVNISTMSANLDPMIYPMFFPRGDAGWHNSINHVLERQTATRQRVTRLQFCAYRIAIRQCFSSLHYGRKLFQQYIVDCYCRVEGERLDYIRRNQTRLRAASYVGLMDHLHAEAEHRNLQPGRMIILPSTFSGSLRNMHQNYLDAMAIVPKFGKPDLFLTFTCNPKWPEITENLLPGLYACDRPDLVSRVFKLKLNQLVKDIYKNHVLGRTVAYVHVIEFQKRGLPHCHMLVNLCNEHKLRTADDIDISICAEIPDPADQNLYEIVKSTMVHGPCGYLNPNSSCMKEGNCSKNFSKEFSNSTILNANGYPLYRRRNNGRTFQIRNMELDNRWIVPYNPYLTEKYHAHINVEACVSIKSVKYLYKYIYKGHDCANIQIQEKLDHNEVKTFLDARYVSAPEAAWRLFSFELHKQSHTIFRLSMHLPEQQQVYFRAGNEAAALERADEHDTHLTAWFKLNQRNVAAREHLYANIPYHFVFKEHAWCTRQRGGEKIVTRLYCAQPSEGERFYLRILLLHVPGATSFESLRTFNGELFPTFREACLARGLLQDNNEWNALFYKLPP
ncbi:uncharacterized protein LOC130627125 [Hydractinia symbiolongicarpus]|uniref:uncharacterized protein LOC130627125 n=1 Tax=Hydractinia symbiolongicarpus TaxID=13093 RepID=UPI00254B1603|nr:uncharacterized protein LOC130627125 [Hydractinia symbiolongicarpus]